MGETIRIQASAGDTDTYLAPARPSPGEPVLLLHAWWGLNETMRDQFVDAPPAGTALPAGSAAHVYPRTKHWFMEPDRPEFDAEATERAYRRTVEFPRANLG